MLIYQILDANRRPVGEYGNLDFALQSAQDMTYWHTGHIFHIEEIEIPESSDQGISFSHGVACTRD
jgi:hypothetical protein